ncbi:glycoside hydrolase family 2 protein [Cohnella nanjingensis]|uniref:Beta galactosidase jelly roll domain-containing protein n=1 Tax=Cohnella nanjingensis TaxID=1387779 RepID=A0A7X0VHZ4_9BACL|nr:sugar-binding domain-containing protein [Cohnella nanjingensis]MBB6674426.1 beta galactosidase jelly roll domain-containing protein [Cohnella nanjingensis]
MSSSIASSVETNLPRPEYPRPDWQRSDWLNLNGAWAFRLDPAGEGHGQPRQDEEASAYDARITVPFSWASPLSGVGANEKGVGWYRRELQWKPAVADSRLFLRFGAVDYSCDVWVNGTHVGTHLGGYGAFEFEVTPVWLTDATNTVVVRAEDNDLTHQARGKQGYGEIRGIWQPVWLEARPQTYVRDAKFATRLDGRVEVTGRLDARQAGKAKLRFDFADGAVRHETELTLAAGENEFATSFDVADPQLWSPETPHLYEGEIRLSGEFGEDAVGTYFGIREIGTAKFGDRDYRWITLNRKPVYLNGTLDQSFHATGYFTYPSDEEMRDEIYLMKRLGLNFVRIHIKPEEPRKLYWADKLGILVMEDMPCFWGNPDEEARASYEREAQEIIERDYNHPSIFSWVMFNETWGLKTNSKGTGLTGDLSGELDYLPETQEWVRERYHWAKRFDPTRIVEDNSPCNRDHVETDINTWHFYINGYEEVRSHLQEVVDMTYPGSDKNYIGGNRQSDAPLMNSECGNVWGIVDGGAGDSDLAWHYRYMLNEFRRHDKMCGFVFTEFRDVVNEFNGYYRLDGSDKQFGYEAFVPGMTLSDLHAPDFIVIDAAPCQTVQAGAETTVALLRSSYADRYHGQTLRLVWELSYDNLGTRKIAERGEIDVSWEGYGVAALAPLAVRMPSQDAVAVLGVQLVDEAGRVVTRNFTTFDVRSGREHGVYEADGGFVSVPVTGFASHTFAHEWSSIQGAKASGGKAGEFVYDVKLPEPSAYEVIGEIEILFEASAKRLLARNVEGEHIHQHGISMMHGASANVEYNPSTYYMTDDEKHEARVNVSVDGERIGVFVLADDPADSRGVLSWHYQPVANKLEEAGSYGYLCQASVPGRLAAKLDRSRSFKLQLQADEGGIALYGRNAGRYPIDLLVRYR